jgi:hypothetical protein
MSGHLDMDIERCVSGASRCNEHRREMARATGLEPAASGVTGRRSNQLSYARSKKSAQGLRAVTVCSFT